jgi:hypothetical protein
VNVGDSIPELKTTPDRFLTIRYAGASGDFNPIHIDEDFAKQVGLPGRSCTACGRWPRWRARRPRRRGGPGSRCSAWPVQFRGMGVPEAEVEVTGRGAARLRDGVAVIDTRAVQNGKAIIRNAEAEVRLPTIQE